METYEEEKGKALLAFNHGRNYKDERLIDWRSIKTNLSFMDTQLEFIRFIYLEFVKKGFICFIYGSVLDEGYQLFNKTMENSREVETNELKRFKNIIDQARIHFKSTIIPRFNQNDFPYYLRSLFYENRIIGDKLY